MSQFNRTITVFKMCCQQLKDVPLLFGFRSLEPADTRPKQLSSCSSHLPGLSR